MVEVGDCKNRRQGPDSCWPGCLRHLMRRKESLPEMAMTKERIKMSRNIFEEIWIKMGG